ncbi:hypothetical protein ACIGXM_30070 [Kitasatospora sp. NPDC052896]|uniref:hypothetical protein n=1 Tax=Kitasatospora sp. NPDC052896 TaxID=3364061 RepID=UPI0037CAE251
MQQSVPTAPAPTRRTVFGVLRTLRELGDGPHYLRRIAEEAQIPVATAHHILADAADFGMAVRVAPDHYSSPGSSSPRPLGTGALPADPAASSPATHSALVTLQCECNGMALLYASLLPAEAAAVCLDRTLGPYEREIHCAPAERRALLWRTSLEAGAVGRVIGGQPAAGQHGYDHGPAPIAGFDLVAAPVWNGESCAGAVAVLLPSYRLSATALREDIATAVTETAAGLSRAVSGRG